MERAAIDAELGRLMSDSNKVWQALLDLARETEAQRTEEVERRLIAGEDRFVIGGPLYPVLYELPRWHEHPIRRLRIAYLRWRAR